MAFKDKVEKKIKACKNREAKKQVATVVQQVSGADELKEFKDLLDTGVITQEEFDFKKKQILGL